jgi:hypothetical protein
MHSSQQWVGEGPLKNVDGVINKPPWFYCTMCYDVQGRPSQSLGWGLCAVVLGFWKDGRGVCQRQSINTRDLFTLRASPQSAGSLCPNLSSKNQPISEYVDQCRQDPSVLVIWSMINCRYGWIYGVEQTDNRRCQIVQTLGYKQWKEPRKGTHTTVRKGTASSCLHLLFTFIQDNKAPPSAFLLADRRRGPLLGDRAWHTQRHTHTSCCETV